MGNTYGYDGDLDREVVYFSYLYLRQSIVHFLNMINLW